MATIDDVDRQPLAQRLGRMGRTADDLAAAIRGQSEVALSRRPDGKSWAAKEVMCHLLGAFQRRRDESLALVRRLTPAELERGCIHPTGRITIDRFVAMMAWHDDNHLDQLKRALEGKV